MDAALVEFEEFDLFLFLAGAENEPKGRFFVGLLFIFGKPAKV